MVKHTRKIALAVAALVAMALGGSALAQAGTAETPDAAGAADTDTVQSGDQSAPDTETADGTNEAAGSEVPGNDGPGGHADEPANPSADHQARGAE